MILSSSRGLHVLFLTFACLFMLCSRSAAQDYSTNQDFPTYNQDPSAYASDLEETPNTSDYSNYGVDDGDDLSLPTEPPAAPGPAPVVPRPAINLAEKTILIGRIPYLSLKDMMQQVRPLLAHLRKETGAKEVRLVTARNYAGVLEALSRDKIDFAWVGPTAYVLARSRDQLMAVARAKHQSAVSYRGVFITRKNSGIQGLDDIKGKTIGFVDPESASGYLYPLYVLHRLKINPHKSCRSVQFLKRHDVVLKAVLDGKIDVGVCLDATLTALADKTQLSQLLILGRTDEVPSDVICCRQDCPTNLREQVQAALLKISPTPSVATGSFPLPTFETATDDEYDYVQTVLQAVAPMAQHP
ncbi:MAG TPA: phosphate/phosphite/phosphonate ABC transporter substrate-binding protein [Candidatus Ozemobacteraceae bacterium]|nr:phosphate/phosphite/phosphonate ABC transporter substrate-binding protein [Candidatus Ozemobacteraceae bacterium]